MSILNNKVALVVGVANTHSIAAGVAQAVASAGAEVALTYVNEKAKPYVQPVAEAVNAALLMPLDVEVQGEMEAVFAAIKARQGRLILACTCLNQHGEMVIEGEARVIAPREKVRRPRVVLPEVHLHVQGAQYARLIAATEALAPVSVAVVHPCDALSLTGALDAAMQGMIIPVMVGPKDRIEAAAREAGRSLNGVEILDTPHSHAAAATAVSLVRSGKVGPDEGFSAYG